MWHLTLLAITEASSYSHEGPLRPPKLMGKDKAVPVAGVENSMAARRDNPFDGLDLENATSASQNQKAVCEMERERAPWPPLPVPEATRCLSQGAVAPQDCNRIAEATATSTAKRHGRVLNKLKRPSRSRHGYLQIVLVRDDLCIPEQTRRRSYRAGEVCFKNYFLPVCLFRGKTSL